MDNYSFNGGVRRSCDHVTSKRVGYKCASFGFVAMQCKETQKVFDYYEGRQSNLENPIFERFKFFNRNQFSGESLEHYVRELVKLTVKCDFGDQRDNLIRDKIICGMLNCKVRERLLREPGLTLQETIAICRVSEFAASTFEERSMEKLARGLRKCSSEPCFKNGSFKELKKKMTVTRSFPYTLGSMMLLAAMGAVLIYDCRRYGSFQSSSTGRFLRDIGALNYGEQAWSKTKYFTMKSYSWAEANVPVYYKSAVEHSKPYLQTCLDMGVGTLNHVSIWYENIRVYVEDSVPVVVAWINHYAPGLLEKSKTFLFDSWESVKYFTILACQILLEYFVLAGEWIKTNIFIGSLSPENLQKYSLEVLNTTQIYAVWTYDWVCQKVQTLSKIQ